MPRSVFVHCLFMKLKVLYDETVVLELAELEKKAKAAAKKYAGSWK